MHLVSWPSFSSLHLDYGAAKLQNRATKKSNRAGYNFFTLNKLHSYIGYICCLFKTKLVKKPPARLHLALGVRVSKTSLKIWVIPVSTGIRMFPKLTHADMQPNNQCLKRVPQRKKKNLGNYRPTLKITKVHCNVM